MTNDTLYASSQTKRKKLEQYLNKDGIYIQRYGRNKPHHISRNRFIVVSLFLALLLIGFYYTI